MLQFIEEVESYIRQRNDNINLMPIRCLEEADDMIKDDCKFLNISEKNMDFLIMENLYNNPEFIKLFLDKIAINDYTIYQIEHSKKGAYGESDITIIIKGKNKKIGLLIEDKIDADNMPAQCNRYFKRGDEGIKCGDYDEYYVFIVAPEYYLDNNAEAKKYPYKISYEECLNVITATHGNIANFHRQIITHAIKTQKKYIKHTHDANTKFWKKYQNFCKNEYPELSLCETEERGHSYKENWVKYNSGIDHILFIHKFMRGHVDVVFSKSVDKVSSSQQLLIEMEKLIKSILPYYKEAGVFIELIGKNSVAYRIYVPILDPMKDSFAVCEKNGWVKSSFRAINLFDRLLKEHKDEFKNLSKKIYSKVS